jgi:DNA adenine methylase
MKGRAIVSLNDVPDVRQVFDGLRIESHDLNYTIASGAAKAVSEVLIYNFETPKLPLFG